LQLFNDVNIVEQASDDFYRSLRFDESIDNNTFGGIERLINDFVIIDSENSTASEVQGLNDNNELTRAFWGPKKVAAATAIFTTAATLTLLLVQAFEKAGPLQLKPPGFFTDKTLDNFVHLYETGSAPAAKAGNEASYQNAENLRLSDLGIGKYIPLQYPWNPANSPNLCKMAGLTDDDGYPLPGCDEYIFTKALFTEVSKNVGDIVLGACDETKKDDDDKYIDCKDNGQNRNYCVNEICSECEEHDNCNADHPACDINGSCQECTEAKKDKCTASGQKGCYKGSCSQCSENNNDHCKEQCGKFPNSEVFKPCFCKSGRCVTVEGTVPSGTSGTAIGRLPLRRDFENSVFGRLKANSDVIENIQSSGASVANVFSDARRDYVNLLNAQTYSLDGMAAINNANNLALRDQLFNDEWNRFNAATNWFKETVTMITDIIKIYHVSEGQTQDTENLIRALTGIVPVPATASEKPPDSIYSIIPDKNKLSLKGALENWLATVRDHKNPPPDFIAEWTPPSLRTLLSNSTGLGRLVNAGHKLKHENSGKAKEDAVKKNIFLGNGNNSEDDESGRNPKIQNIQKIKTRGKVKGKEAAKTIPDDKEPGEIMRYPKQTKNLKDKRDRKTNRDFIEMKETDAMNENVRATNERKLNPKFLMKTKKSSVDDDKMYLFSLI